MKKINITIPTKNQLWGLKAWDVIKECGPQVAGTDLVNFLNGGNAEDRYNTKDGKLACSAWTSTAGSCGYVRCVGADGGMYNECPDSRTPAVRPVISNPKSILSNLTWEKQGDIYVTRYGEYPQDKVVDPQLSAELEETYHSGRLVATGKKYTFDSTSLKAYDVSFQPVQYPEYIHNGKKYIRFLNIPSDVDLKNVSRKKARKIKRAAVRWVEVQPIEWYSDEIAKILLSKKALTSRLQIINKEEYDCDFKSTPMYEFLNGSFLDEIQPSQPKKVAHAVSFALVKAKEDAIVKSKA